jgi:hypothetical protein
MPILAKQAEKFFMNYVRGGGKQNRKKQVDRIIEFLNWVESTETVISLYGIGKRQVIGFWKSHRNLSDATAYKYWLGICKLWEWLEKHEKPPKPFKQGIEPKREMSTEHPVFQDLSSVIQFVRKNREISILKLANLSGCESWLIEAIESGKTNVTFSDVQILLQILGVKYTY